MDLQREYLFALGRCSGYPEAERMVLKSSPGGIWLIGPTVYDLLIQEHYHIGEPELNFSFAVDTSLSSLQRAAGWRSAKPLESSHIFAKLFNGAEPVIIEPLEKMKAIMETGSKPSIENYLATVPLTYQSIAFDVRKQKLIGKGVEAIRGGVVEINNLHFARISAINKGQTPVEYMLERAHRYCFRPIIPQSI
jgi:hypothetical protein